MKLALLLMMMPVLCFAALPEGDFIGSRGGIFEGINYDFRLTKKALKKAPQWDRQHAEFPPLSPKQAEAAAWLVVKQRLAAQQANLHVRVIALEALEEAKWIYLITFDYHPGTAYSGPAREFTVPVYLDGTMPEPIIRRQ